MEAIQFIQTTPDNLRAEITRDIVYHIEALFKSSKAPDSEELLTNEEAATFLKLSRQGLYNRVKDGKIKSYALGNKIYFKKSEILESLTPLNK